VAVTRTRAGFVVIFVIGILIVALGAYSLYYFVSTEYARATYIFGGLGSVAFGSVLTRVSYPIFIPLKEYSMPTKSCSHCGANVTENAMVCEKCKQPIDDN
jgi:hypothetical protein